jgi:cyclohexa-1,5-dienecarbonyl-CoA hydratase
MMIRERIEGGVATLTLDHPPLNVLTQALLGELREALRRLAKQSDLRAVVLAAAGRHFSAGADVAEHLPPTFRTLIPEFVETIERVFTFPLPVFAAVRGRCLGGGFELVQAADVVVAGESASFGQPEILLGVTAPIACVLLPRRVAPGVAAELLYTGDPLPARRALETGLVQRVVADAEVETEALALAARCARLSGAALRATKRTLLATMGEPRPDALRGAAALYMNEVMETHDAQEGLNAFLEKREPSWSHR